MPFTHSEDSRLTRLEATLWEDSRYAYVRHEYYGWQSTPQERVVWRRTYKPIGQGSFGAVFCEECIGGSSKGAVRAVKSLQKPSIVESPNSSGDNERIDYGRELEAIARFSNPQYARFFVQSAGWYEDAQAVFVTMELVPYGNLQQHIGLGLPESEAKVIVTQVLQGLGCMHRAGYAHRDLKPQNLLVVHRGPSWHVKIADFGLSKRIVEHLSSLRTVAGTPGYTAPEVLGILRDDDINESEGSEDGSRQSYTNAVDIWGVGAISFILLTGELPFPSQNFRSLGKYVNGRALFPIDKLEAKSVSTSGCVQIENFMAPDPNDRPDADAALEREWLKRQYNPSQLGMPIPRSQISHPSRSEPDASARWTGTVDSGYQTESLRAWGSSHTHGREGPTESTVGWQLYKKLTGHSTPVSCVALSPDGLLMACSSLVASVKTGLRSLKSLLLPNLRISAWQSEELLVTLWNLDGVDMRPPLHLQGKYGEVSRMVFSPDNRQLIIGCADGSVDVWTIDGHGAGSLRSMFPGLGHGSLTAACKACSPDGRLVARSIHKTGHDANGPLYYNFVAEIWNLSNETSTKIPAPSTACNVAFSPDSRLVAYCATDHIDIRVFDVRTGELMKSSSPEEDASWNRATRPKSLQGRSLMFSPDGRLLAIAGARDVLLWNVETGRLMTFVEGYRDTFLAIAFSPDGGQVASGSKDGTVGIWDIATGDRVKKLESHSHSVKSIVFSTNGRHLVSGAADGTVRLWNLMT